MLFCRNSVNRINMNLVWPQLELMLLLTHHWHTLLEFQLLSNYSYEMNQKSDLVPLILIELHFTYCENY